MQLFQTGVAQSGINIFALLHFTAFKSPILHFKF